MLLAIWKENQLIMNRHDQTLQNWAEAWSCLSNRIDKQQTKFLKPILKSNILGIKFYSPKIAAE